MERDIFLEFSNVPFPFRAYENLIYVYLLNVKQFLLFSILHFIIRLLTKLKFRELYIILSF